MLKAMVRVAPPQPSEAIARIAPVSAAAQRPTTFYWSTARVLLV
jgi:hypothetical protein